MPPGKRRKNYNDANVEQAVKAVKEEGMSLRQASEAFNVPKSTILDNTKKDQLTAIGRPTVLTAREETLILESVQLLASWGFPLHGDDLRHFVKAYLDKKGVKTRFKDNLPTYKWLKPFLNRHKDFTFRKTNPIKRARAKVTRQDIREFFAHYAKAVEGIPPENIYNYDETNFRDDPQSKKGLFKKGTKYCEKVQNTSKQAEMAKEFL
jgi:hypothetical protein